MEWKEVNGKRMWMYNVHMCSRVSASLLAVNTLRGARANCVVMEKLWKRSTNRDNYRVVCPNFGYSALTSSF